MHLENKRYWGIFLVGLSSALLLLWSAYDYSKESLIEVSQERIPQKHEILLKEIESFKADKQTLLSMLVRHPDVEAYLDNPDETNRRRVEHLFFHQTEGTSAIMQLRLLGIDGKERIRIDQHAGQITLQPSEKLQDKSNRDYFIRFKTLKAGEIGFSSLDLNVENNRVEIPFKPTLRIGMPVYVNNTAKGIVIINYAMEPWLEQINVSAFLKIYLLSTDGYFIAHPDPSLRWSGHLNPPIRAETVLNQRFDHLPENRLVHKGDFLATTVRLWDGRLYPIVYQPRLQMLENVNEHVSIVGILILAGFIALLLPFGKLLNEYIRNLLRTRETLQESEQRLQAIFNNTLDAIIIINASGIIHRCNRASTAIFGYDEEELIGSNVNLLVPEPHHSRHNDYIRSHDTSITSKIIGHERELFGLHKEGRLIPISLGITQVYLDNELFFIGTVRDVSHEKQSKQLFEKVFSEAPNGIALVLKNGRFWRLNERFCSIVGYSEDEMRTLTFQQITHPDDLQSDLALAVQLAEGKIPSYSLEKRYIHKNGSIVWINLTASAIFLDLEHTQLEYFIAVIEDISERKAMLETLANTQAGLMEAEQIAMLGHWSWDVVSDTLYWSENMLRLFGETSESFHNRFDYFLSMVHPDDRENLHHSVRTATETHAPFEIHYRIRTREGAEKIIYTKGSISYNGDKPVRMFGTCQDVTQIKQLEEKEKDQERMLMQQSKLVAMGEMVGAIAHQWRQPLNTIGLTIQDLLLAYRHNELDEAYLKSSQTDMMQQLNYMSQTIDEFRNFFTKSQSVGPFNLLNAINEVVQLYWAQLKAHNITLAIECRYGNEPAARPFNELTAEEKKSFDLIGASSELKQVILNCIANAKDAILSLKEANRFQRTITVILHNEGETLHVIIQDLAGGMSDEVRQRIFEPYYTTRNMGTGLGLYIAKMITERTLHGTIVCNPNTQSIDGADYTGTIFIISLPKGEKRE